MSSKNVSAATSPPCHDGRSQTEKCGDGHHRGITMVGHTMMVVVQTKLNEPRRGDCDGTTRRSFDGERAAGDTHHHHRPTEQQTSSPRSSSSATPLAWPAASKLPSRARPLFSYGESSSSRASRRHAQRRRLQDGPRGANERRAVEGSFARLRDMIRIRITAQVMNGKAWTRRRIGSLVTSSISRSTRDVRFHPLRGVLPQASRTIAYVTDALLGC